MSQSPGYFKNAAGKVGNFLDRISNIFDSEDPIIILPYRGYANETRIYVKGRVLENEDIFIGQTENKIQNLINTVKRFETDEMAFANVRISIHNQVFDVETDTEGYFILDSEWNAPPKEKENDWLTAQVELIGLTNEDQATITATAEIYFPSKNADYGVISDIDDTVLQSHTTSRFKLKMLYATFLQDASKRLPMEGVVELFQAFVKGGDGKRTNPIFYVSHSPWNIYDLLEQFMEMQKLPKGPLLLRDFGITPSGEYSNHKITTIKHILAMYPNIPFVLLGDASQKDADFYLELAKSFPDRIKAIYIRKNKDNKNARRSAELIEANSNINAILVNSSAEMIAHGKQHGLL